MATPPNTLDKSHALADRLDPSDNRQSKSRPRMKDPNAAAAIETRLKYDWIVLLFGFLCVLAQLVGKGDLGYFFILIVVFVFVEVFAVVSYRKLQNGGEGYHMQTGKTLDQSTGFAWVLICMIFDAAILIAVSAIFLWKSVEQCGR